MLVQLNNLASVVGGAANKCLHVDMGVILSKGVCKQRIDLATLYRHTHSLFFNPTTYYISY